MKPLFVILTLIFTLLRLQASSDEENHPSHLEKEIIASPFVFVGKLKITDYRFISEEAKIVDDSNGVIWKDYKTNKYESKIIPDRVQLWSTVTPSTLLKGDKKILKPFLKESWLEPSRVICPHHSNALSGDSRIWFLIISKDFRIASLRSMPIRHLEAVKSLLNKKMENKSQ